MRIYTSCTDEPFYFQGQYRRCIHHRWCCMSFIVILVFIVNRAQYFCWYYLDASCLIVFFILMLCLRLDNLCFVPPFSGLELACYIPLFSPSAVSPFWYYFLIFLSLFHLLIILLALARSLCPRSSSSCFRHAVNTMIAFYI